MHVMIEITDEGEIIYKPRYDTKHAKRKGFQTSGTNKFENMPFSLRDKAGFFLLSIKWYT